MRPARAFLTACLITCLIGCLAASVARAADEPAARVTFAAATPATADSPQTTAVGLRAAPAGPAGAAQVAVLVDTSATQTGVHRQRTLEALAGLLAAARQEDRYAVAAVDVDTVPLGEGFLPASDPTLRAGVRKLDARTPLGSTDIVAALQATAARFAGPGPKSIIFIGNGPGLGGIDPEEFAVVVDEMRSRRIAFSGLGIGPGVNWQCLGALAANTGGMLSIPGETEDCRQAAATLGRQAVEPISWPLDVAIAGQAAAGELRLIPARLPPLRSDRDSIVLVEGGFRDGRLEIKLAENPAGSPRERSVSLPLPDVDPTTENAYLGELARNARGSDGLFLPVVGREGLDRARSVVRGEAAALAALSVQAQATGAHASAVRLAEASLRRDPDNQEASVIREVARRQVGGDGAVGLAGALPPAADDELQGIDAQRRIRAQQQEQDAAVRIRQARQLLAADPDQAREDLKALQQEIRSSDDLDAGSRERLLAQLEMRIRESIVRAREKTDRDLAAERRAAIGRERLRMTTDLQRREEKIKQLTEKYNALVEEGIRLGYAQAEYYPTLVNGEAVIGAEAPTRAFVEAERVAGEEIAREAPPLYANYPIPMTARVVGRTAPLVARILQYDSQNYRTNRDQQRGFMDALHLVDVAAIPFVDEPPIVYPSPDRWREITRLREKYKSVDLANPGSKEKEIYEALEKPVSRWEFNESPLRDVQRAIADEFRIPVEIDTRALEDAGLDADIPVSQNTSGISLRSALRRLLGNVDLAYVVKDEVLLITTKEKADENLVVKVYPVADLVLPVDPGSGLNPFQTGGGLGGANAINSGQNLQGGLGMQGGQGMNNAGPFCWVAREVYGVHNPRWLAFRAWISTEAPEWLRDLYAARGEQFANWLRDKPLAKSIVRAGMDRAISGRIHSVAETGAGVALFQVAGAKSRLAERSTAAVLPAKAPVESATEPADAQLAGSFLGRGLPAEVLGATDLRSALAAYLPPPEGGQSVASESDRPPASNPGIDAAEAADRLAQLRLSAAQLGHRGDFARAAELLQAAIACGHAEPWMYESLAVALEASGAPRSDVERSLLSAAAFATSSAELMQLAHYLARFGANAQAVRICRQVTRGDPTNREAYALAMTLAAKTDDTAALRWACPGVLSHDWPANQRDVATRAARLAKATIETLRQADRDDEAAAFQAAVDAALVRDIEVEVSWTGDADIDIAVQEPAGSVCSIASPRSLSGGTLLADGEAGGDGTTHRERYIAAEAFPGEYRILIRRSWGSVAADTVTAEITIHKGTDRERSLRRQIRLGADEHLLAVPLPEGRRREPLHDAQLVQDVQVQRSIGRNVLAQQLAAISDPTAAAAVSQSRGTPLGQPVPGFPFFGRGAVGYQPIVTTLPEGVNMYARAVVSADRRYVRITAVPLFSGVGQVTTFSWVTGDTQNVTDVAAGAGGFQGAGGVPAGPGQQPPQPQPQPCWVAREVYGAHNPRWLLFRDWLTTDAPPWLLTTYLEHGEAFATWIHDKPALKAGLRLAMDAAIADRLSAGGR